MPARVLFLVFPLVSGASGEIRSREWDPAKSLPFIPLPSFLRSQPAGRAALAAEEGAFAGSRGRRWARGDPGWRAPGAVAALPPPQRRR